MASIIQALHQQDELTKELGLKLIEFYRYMKELEADQNKGGKQATLIVITITDIINIFEQCEALKK